RQGPRVSGQGQRPRQKRPGQAPGAGAFERRCARKNPGSDAEDHHRHRQGAEGQPGVPAQPAGAVRPGLRRDRSGLAKARRAIADLECRIRRSGGRQRAGGRGAGPGPGADPAGQAEEEISGAPAAARAMPDPRFFDRTGPHSLAALAALSGARLSDPSAGERLFDDVAPLETAGPGEVTFLDNRKYADAFSRSQAGAAFVEEGLAAKAPPGMVLLLTGQPYKAFALAAQAFYPAKPVIAQRAPSALIDPGATVPADCDIGPHVVIE